MDGGYRVWGDAVPFGTWSRLCLPWHCVQGGHKMWWWEVASQGGACSEDSRPASGGLEALSPPPGPGPGWFDSWGFGFTPDSLPQPLGPSARLVSAPRDCLLYFLPLWLRVRCVPEVSVSREWRVLFELQQDCWFRIIVKRLWVSNRFSLFNLKRLSMYPQG